MSKIAVIGAGPSGIYCAVKLLELLPDCKITIFDKSSPLKTLLQTGNGRCNLAYNEGDFKALAGFYPRGEKFLYSVFARYGLYETLFDFEKLGVKTYVQPDNRIFPEKNSAAFVRKKLLGALDNRIEFVQKEVIAPPPGFSAVILSTGLKSGAGLAKKYGHKIIPLKPSLTGLKIAEGEFAALEGVSFGGVIFTKTGVSGPFIYKLSSINARKNFPYKIEIPLIDLELLTKMVQDNPKKLFRTVVSEFIPGSLASVLVKENKQCANSSKKDIEGLKTLVLTTISPDGRGEIVHSGGVCLDEIDKNFKSKIAKNLWIIGELLDIDGFTGGFNLQNCWSSAAIAAYDIAKKLRGAL